MGGYGPHVVYRWIKGAEVSGARCSTSRLNVSHTCKAWGVTSSSPRGSCPLSNVPVKIYPSVRITDPLGGGRRLVFRRTQTKTVLLEMTFGWRATFDRGYGSARLCAEQGKMQVFSAWTSERAVSRRSEMEVHLRFSREVPDGSIL